MPPRRFLTFTAAFATAAAIVGIALVAGHAHDAAPASDPSAAPPQTPAVGSWAAAAAALEVTSKGDRVPRYRREEFGPTWVDIDGNGCTQREDALARDLTDLVRTSCTIVSGTLHDPYTGVTVPFPRQPVARSSGQLGRGVRIDRIVGLRTAYAGGAWEWEPERRQEFANSLENLLAVDDAAALEKRGRGPSKWLPSDDDFVCEYAIRYTWIATAWKLAVPAADRDALTTTLVGCKR